MSSDAEIENSNLTTNGKLGYKNVINNIHNNPFSRIKLKDLTIEDIQEYVDGLYFGVYDNEGNQIASFCKRLLGNFLLLPICLIIFNLSKPIRNLMQMLKEKSCKRSFFFWFKSNGLKSKAFIGNFKNHQLLISKSFVFCHSNSISFRQDKARDLLD